MIAVRPIAENMASVRVPDGPLVAALPMYDWPERRAEVDAEWAALRDAFRAMGIPAPEKLARRNADLPPVPGGIRDAAGNIVAPDPAELPANEFDLAVLWQHPALLFAQTCHGPLEFWLKGVSIIGQEDYSDVEGGEGELYSSAIVMRRTDSAGNANLVQRLRGLRLAYNVPDSMSGYLALERELETQDADFSIFSGLLASGGHRKSIRMVAAGEADVAAIDAKSWKLALQYEPTAKQLQVIGWTRKRKGLPFITGLPFNQVE